MKCERRRRRKAQVAAVYPSTRAPSYTIFNFVGRLGNTSHSSDSPPLDPEIWKATEQGELVRVIKPEKRTET